MGKVNFILFVVLLGIGISSCSMEKRKYRSGFYLEKRNKIENDITSKRKINDIRSKSIFFSNSEIFPRISELQIVQDFSSTTIVDCEKWKKDTSLIVNSVRKNNSLQDTIIRNWKHPRNPKRFSIGTMDTHKLFLDSIKLMLIALGMGALGILIAIAEDFNLNGTSKQAMWMLVAILLVAIAMPLFICSILLFLIVGIVLLARKHKLKKVNKE